MTTMAKKTKKKSTKTKPKTKPATLRVPKTPVSEISPEQAIIGATFLGKVQGFYAQIGVATLTLEAPLAVGDGIRVKGHTTDLTQRVEKLEVDHETVQSAAAGEGVGVLLADRVRIGDAVYKL
jgi:hypothetical protein